MRRASALAVLAVLLSAASARPAGRIVGCDRAQTRALVIRFVNGFNRGDARTLNKVWGSKDWFKWYSVSNDPGKRIEGESMRRDTLLSYFAARHAQRERLTLRTLQIGAYSIGNRDFTYSLWRNADDLPDGPVVYDGKGASSCVVGRLIVWSMGVSNETRLVRR